MDDNSEALINCFHKVASKGYIKGIGESWGNIGLTFENEIGKLPDSKYTPDYGDIEIKCSSRFSRYPLYLFTVAFDSSENEVLRIADKYGHSDFDFPDKKVIFQKVKNAIIEDNKYNFIFDIDMANEKIYLCVFDENGKLIERDAYITFTTLKKHIMTKLNKIAYIKASMRKVDDKKYYRYYSMFLYKLKNFDIFLNLIDRNLINIEIIARISKSGPDKGRYRNKNIVFSIRKENIPLLYDCYYQYDYDRKY